MTATPDAEVQVDEPLLRALLESQQPDLAHLPIRALDAGWDNLMIRLGEDLIVRLPRRAVAAQLIEHEQRWLPALTSRLPVPISAPVRTGVAQHGYPWSWSILPYFDGTTVDKMPLGGDQAQALANFLIALHQPAPNDAPVNSVRGGKLADRAAAFEERAVRIRAKTSCLTPALERCWRSAVDLPLALDRHWLHGDLHARNVLARNQSMQAVIDWGDITAGDAATDLASVWMLLGSQTARDSALASYGADDELRLRAMGWAILFGVMLLDTGLVDHPAHAQMGRVTLARLDEDLCRV